MRLVPTLFLLALASMAGCGGCDACGSTKAGDLTSTTSPQATTEPVVVETHDSGVKPTFDAGGDASSASVPTTPVVPLAVSAPPRPRGPMPMGDYQSCGVYDGPLCTKECKNGNCRQECDGTDCVLTCAGGYCSQMCGASGTCRLNCKGGHCVQVCTADTGCIKDCAGGSCE